MRAFKYALLGIFAICMMFVSPTDTKASETVPSDDIYVVVEFETLEYGQWKMQNTFQVPLGAEDYGRAFDAYLRSVDQTNGANARIRLYFEDVRDEWRGDLFYTIDTYFEFDIDTVFLRANQVKLNVYTIDYNYNTLSLVYGDVQYEVSDYTLFVEKFGLLKPTDAFVFEFEFNVHELLGDAALEYPSYQSYLMFGSVGVRYEPYFPSIPNYGVPDLDFGDLDDISGLRPSGPLAKFLNNLMSYGYVLTVLCMGMTLGVICFVLFGEKK